MVHHFLDQLKEVGEGANLRKLELAGVFMSQSNRASLRDSLSSTNIELVLFNPDFTDDESADHDDSEEPSEEDDGEDTPDEAKDESKDSQQEGGHPSPAKAAVVEVDQLPVIEIEHGKELE